MVSGLDRAGAEVFTKKVTGWYILPGIVQRFPIEITPDECRKIKVLTAAVDVGDAHMKTRLDIDEQTCMQLTAGNERREPDSPQPGAPSSP